MIKVVVLDFDEVINRSECFSERYMREFGVSREVLGEFFTKEFYDCKVGRADLKERLTPYLDKWGWSGTVEELMKYWFMAENMVDERVIKVVKNLRQRGIPCYLATNNERYRMEYIINELGMGEVFDETFFSCELGVAKPAVEFFDKVYDKIVVEHSVSPEEIGYWDDLAENVAGAREAGWSAEQYIGFAKWEKQIQPILT